MISYKIPHKARFYPLSFQVTFNLNNPITDGTFQGNERKEILKLQKNSVYLFERLSLSCNIPEEIFQQSLQNNAPILNFYKNDNEPLWSNPFQVINYQHERDVSTFIHTIKDVEKLYVQLGGVLNQVPDTIGINQINFNVQVNFFIMDMNSYNKYYREELEAEYGKSIQS
jgi:hypothetical protein